MYVYISDGASVHFRIFTKFDLIIFFLICASILNLLPIVIFKVYSVEGVPSCNEFGRSYRCFTVFCFVERSSLCTDVCSFLRVVHNFIYAISGEEGRNMH
ncbi:hypothetical protein Y032_0257g416 [Ancylostoma ceylanicum]|uniref:Uncharacterized protein n=1 Tax=Ancylostoma ceylanicum TaxID=53326 RepID=A0A016SBN2_9BILA|nr:hypothetical protein Y032_0257g416 [Ancylostoma ceylanicum]